MSTYIELEIQNLLNEVGDLDTVCDRIIDYIEASPDRITLDNITAVSKFLVNSHSYLRLITLVVRHLDNEAFPIPWPYFLEALGSVGQELDNKTLKALIEGIEEDSAEGEAARSRALKSMTELGEWRSNRKYKIHKDYLNNKRQLLEQLITLRTQQLYEQEKKLLQRLQKLYPGDDDIKREVSQHKQRYALEILQKRTPKARGLKQEDLSPKDPEVDKALAALEQSLIEHGKENPNMAFDFAIAAFMFESYETALTLLDLSPETPALAWLRLEVLLKCRRFVELLNELSKVELSLAAEPETFFATAYLRAQALWGLGQKHTAIEVMEGLLTSRPHYRAASALISVWRTQ